MKVIEIKEDHPEKGVCSMEVELTKEEIDFYVEYALNDIITKGMETHEKLFKKDEECKE